MDMSLATTAAFAIGPLSVMGSLSITNLMDNAIDRAFFDRKYRVNTSMPMFGLGNRFKLGARGEGYMPTPVRTIRNLLAALPIDHEKFRFVDLGSGMGRTLMVAAGFGFKSCTGIELSEELNMIGEENVRAYREAEPEGSEIECLCMDAAEYDLPEDAPIVLYFFNPFPKAVMQSVADRIAASYEKRPRDIYVINFHPRPGNPVTGLPSLKRITPVGATTDIFEVYQTRAVN